MTETRWTKVGTFTTQVEADEVLSVLVAAGIPYTQSGVLGPQRTGSIEFHVPNDFVEAAKAAFARARERSRGIRASALPATPDEAADQAALHSGVEQERRRVRNFARAQLAILGIIAVAIGFGAVAKSDAHIAPRSVVMVLGCVLLVVLVRSLVRGRRA